jgi:PAS domain S-box-containing protein
MVSASRLTCSPLGFAGRLLHALVLIIVTLIGLFPGASHAIDAFVQQRALVFNHLATEDGLSQNGVTAFAQDNHGLIWIGTQEGLNLFDGYEFRNFYHQIDDPQSLSHDQIWALLVDQSGRIWIGTDDGLDQFNPATQSFSTFSALMPGAEGRSKTITVYALAETQDGSIWVGTNLGLARISPQSTVDWYFFDLTRQDSIGGGSVRAIYVDQQDVVWVGTELGGLSVFDAQGRLRARHQHDPLNEQSIADNHVRTITSDRDGRIWVGTNSQGLSILDPRDGRWQHAFGRQTEMRDLPGDRIRTLLRDEQGDIWVGVDGGLALWQPRNNAFQVFTPDLSNPRSLRDETILQLFQDRGGVIWVGTFNGISRFNANVEKFPLLKVEAQTAQGVTSPSISSFAEDSDGNLWVGTFEGLGLWRPEGAEATFIEPQSIGMSGRRVMAIKAFDDEVWAGTMIGGLNVIRDGRVAEVFRYRPDLPTSLSANAVSKIYEDASGRRWVTTYGAGVNLYLGEGLFRRFPDMTRADASFSDLRTLDIVEVEPNRFWIATDGGGITVLDATTGRTDSLRHDPDNPGSLSSDNIVTLLRSEDGVWVGTRDRGLDFYDFASGDFKHYSKSNGLASDAVFGLLEDSMGRIWISGGKGLSVLDPIEGVMEAFDASHGLQNTDFNSGAFLSLNDGLFVFGGNSGFNVFNPIEIRTKNTYLPPVAITQISKFNRPVYFTEEISFMDRLVLDYSDSVVGFEFAAADYTMPEKNHFRYRLVGFDADWVDALGDHQATYTNLDAGTYRFEVMGSNNDGLWNPALSSLEIEVMPPPWQTWWAYLGYLGLFCVSLFLLLQSNSRRQRFEAEKRYSERLQLYIESLEQATDCVLIADGDGTVLFANHAIESFFGLTASASQGRPLWSILFKDVQQAETARAALGAGERFVGEIVGTDSDTGPAIEVTIAQVMDTQFSGAAAVAIARDITRRKQTEAELDVYRRNLETLVEERSAALQRETDEHKQARGELAESLREKELLLKEVHHRVKNNMQVISSLLSLQSHAQRDPMLGTLLNESQQRIKSMALIHEGLYQSDNLLGIQFDAYVRNLATDLCRFYAVPNMDIQLQIDVGEARLGLDAAVPCGLIINELVTNALKHGFKGRQGTGQIRVTFTVGEDMATLEVADSGVGLPEDFTPSGSTSMGMDIVSVLAEQLDGTLRHRNEAGAVFSIEFPKGSIQ